MRKKSKVLWLLAVTMLVALLLAACGGGRDNSVPGDTVKPGDAVEPGGVSEPPVIAAEKVLRISRSWEDSSWDPATFTGADQLALSPEIFETLIRLATDGSYTPLLAESWEIAADGLTYTFNLRQGARFHHGYGEMTSSDVKFTFERNADEAVGSIHFDDLNMSNLAAIETPDDYTVIFKLYKPDADFLTRCTMYSSIIVSEAAFADKGLDGSALFPIGTGPFQFDKGTPGNQTECVKFDGYWGEPAKIDRIINTIISDTNTNYSAFENGELDAIFVYYLDKVNEYMAAGYRELYMPTRQILYVGVNMQMTPFDNEKVREAFFAAIDPQYYLNELFYGTETFTGGYIPPTSKYALTDYMKYNYDPIKAKSLLEEAGYADGAKITLWSVNDDISPAPALVTQSQLQDAGFTVELQLVDFGVFISKVRGGEAGMWLLYNSTPPTADETINRYTSSFYPGSNWIGLQDKTYDDLVAQGLAADTEAEKAGYFEAAQKRLIDLNILYPISTYGYNMIMQPSISGVEIYGDNTLSFRNVEFN